MAIDDCLKQLKLDYIDMMLIHWPQGYAEKMGLGNLPKVNFTEQEKIFIVAGRSRCCDSIGCGLFRHMASNARLCEGEQGSMIMLIVKSIFSCAPSVCRTSTRNNCNESSTLAARCH
jgi:hypothetical protein